MLKKICRKRRDKSKITYILVTSAILAFCNSACTHTHKLKFQETLGSWIGAPLDTLVERWGAPSANFVMSDGKTVMSYDTERLVSRTVYYYYHPEMYSSSYRCRINFITDAKKKSVVKVSSSGDSYTCWQMVSEMGKAQIKKPTP